MSSQFSTMSNTSTIEHVSSIGRSVSAASYAAARRLRASAAAIAARLRRKRLIAVTQRELSKLDDRLLRDIGIERIEIDHIARDGLPFMRMATEASPEPQQRH